MIRSLLLLATATATALLVACSTGPGRPTDKEVNTLVETYFDDALSKAKVGEGIGYKFLAAHSEAPPADSFQCGVTAGLAASMKVTSVDWGKFNEEDKYWPARISVEGICLKEMPSCGEHRNQLCPPVDTPFKVEKVRIKLKQDDFGKWQLTFVKP